MGTTPSWVKVGWATAIGMLLILLSVLLSVTPLTKGYGVSLDQGGQFVLRRGTDVAPISQGLGFALAVVEAGLGVTILVGLLSSFWLILAEGTLRMEDLLDEEVDAEKAALEFVRLATAAVAVGFVVFGATIFWYFFQR